MRVLFLWYLVVNFVKGIVNHKYILLNMCIYLDNVLLYSFLISHYYLRVNNIPTTQ